MYGANVGSNGQNTLLPEQMQRTLVTTELNVDRLHWYQHHHRMGHGTDGGVSTITAVRYTHPSLMYPFGWCTRMALMYTSSTPDGYARVNFMPPLSPFDRTPMWRDNYER